MSFQDLSIICDDTYLYSRKISVTHGDPWNMMIASDQVIAVRCSMSNADGLLITSILLWMLIKRSIKFLHIKVNIAADAHELFSLFYTNSMLSWYIVSEHGPFY